MNFQYIPPVESSETLLNLAFGKAREKEKGKKLQGSWLEIIRIKEGLKLDIVKDTLIPRLRKITDDFPRIKQLPEFYQKLMHLTLDVGEFKQALAGIDWAIDKIRFFHREYARKIGRAQQREKINEYSRQFYGRLASVVKKQDKNFAYLEWSRKVMKTYPDLQEMFTVCIYGFPNVGKSTLLNKLTGTTAEVAPYAFTTKTINAGYLTIAGQKVQILDVPGTLARKEKMNVIELQADLVMRDIANVIIFVFDLSGYSGYAVKKQEQLYRSLGREKKVLTYLSKLDLTPAEVLSEFKHKYYPVEELKEKIADELRKDKDNIVDQESLANSKTPLV